MLGGIAHPQHDQSVRALDLLTQPRAASQPGPAGCPISAAKGVYMGEWITQAGRECCREEATVNSDLIARAQGGDEEAFRHLVDGHQRELHVHRFAHLKRKTRRSAR